MATHAHITPAVVARRRLARATRLTSRRAAPITVPNVRARLEEAIQRAIETLDAFDAQRADLEPDADAEPDTDDCCQASDDILAPKLRSERVRLPTLAEMRAAYRRNGDPIPANLRGLLGRAWA